MRIERKRLTVGGAFRWRHGLIRSRRFGQFLNGSTKQVQLYKESLCVYRKMQSKTANDLVLNTASGFVMETARGPIGHVDQLRDQERDYFKVSASLCHPANGSWTRGTRNSNGGISAFGNCAFEEIKTLGLITLCPLKIYELFHFGHLTIIFPRCNLTN